MPLYFFGNTSVLSIPKSQFLESISRSMQMSLTLFWGQWGLPIPRQNKVGKGYADRSLTLTLTLATILISSLFFVKNAFI